MRFFPAAACLHGALDQAIEGRGAGVGETVPEIFDGSGQAQFTDQLPAVLFDHLEQGQPVQADLGAAPAPDRPLGAGRVPDLPVDPGPWLAA